MKLLYILNIANKVNSFSYTSMKAAQKLGIEYHIAGNWNYTNEEERKCDEARLGIRIYQIDFIRTPYHPGNIKAYKQLEKIVKQEHFDAIHCNTPIGGVVGRLLGKKYNIKTVLYQAHGFHFFDHAPVVNWLIYYPIERFLARFTDALITINEEDYKRAHTFKLRKNGKVYFVPGVGIDTTEYLSDAESRKKKREELGISDKEIMLISAGDLVKRKNYDVSIHAISKANDSRLQFFICGVGPENQKLNALVKSLDLQKQIHFLGYRNDIKELLNAADIFLFTTLQEGLPRSLSEAMAMGLPSISSKIRGNVDLIENRKQGILCSPSNAEEFATAINELADSELLREKMSKESKLKIKQFDIDASQKALIDVYTKELLEK
jgi:glycosyltransferase involved in cell wall biosynthesis